MPPGHTLAPAKIKIVFFRTPAGSEPVREWLKGLPDDQRKLIGQDLMRVQYGWPVGMPLVGSLGGGLHEVRTSLQNGTIARVFFCFHAGELYALHAIIKKTQKTPPAALALARKRQKEVTNG